MRSARLLSASAAVLLLLLTVHIDTVSPSKILGYLITGSRSHFIIQDSLMRGLAARGHDVTVVAVFPPPVHNTTNYRYIHIEMGAANEAAWEAIKNGLLDPATKQDSFVYRWPKVLVATASLNAETYANPLVQRLRREESFDLVVMGWFLNDYQVGIAAGFRCPAVVVTSTPSMGFVRSFVGNPNGSPYTQMPMLPFNGIRMSFVQRAANALALAAEAVITEAVVRFYMQPFYERHFPAGEYPSFADARRNVSLVMVTSHFSQGVITANFPALVEVSGMHIPKEQSALPKVSEQIGLFLCTIALCHTLD